MSEEPTTSEAVSETANQLTGPQAAAQGRSTFEGVLRNPVVQEVAKHLKVSESEIDNDTPLTAIGLESLALFSMTGGLAEWMEQDIPVTLLFEIESINDLVLKMADIACPE